MTERIPYLKSCLNRRSFLAGSAAAVAGVFLPLCTEAAETSIHDLRGEVLVNGKRIGKDAVIRAGDSVVTTSNGYVVFVVGQDAFMLRERGELRLEPHSDSFLIMGLRLVTGALGAVFGRRQQGRVNIMGSHDVRHHA